MAWLDGFIFIGDFTLLPDYHTDNEIDRMVRGLSESELLGYTHRLAEVVGGYVWNGPLLTATEDQKREAYLKAKGAWTE